MTNWRHPVKSGNPTQHARLLLDDSDVFGCQRGSLSEVPVLAAGEHPVDHAAVDVHMSTKQRATRPIASCSIAARFSIATELMATQRGKAGALCGRIQLGRRAHEAPTGIDVASIPLAIS
jgi:hypothetical protein